MPTATAPGADASETAVSAFFETLSEQQKKSICFGWNYNETERGLLRTHVSNNWQINSVGWISGSGRDYLIAVLSTGNPTEQYGIDTIDQLSATVWNAMA